MLKEIYYFFYRLIRWKIRPIPREIKWFIQRGKRGWATEDWWDANYYLAKVMSGMFKEFAKNGISYPPQFRSRKQWERILLKISKAMDDYLSADDELYAKYIEGKEDPDWKEYAKQFNKRIKKVKEALNLMGEHWGHFWD